MPAGPMELDKGEAGEIQKAYAVPANIKAVVATKTLTLAHPALCFW